MKRLAFALTIAAALSAFPRTSFAEDAPPAAPAEPTPEWTFPASVDITTDYIFRGLTQTKKDPALQAGIEVDHASGFYAGAWGSNISWLHDYNHDVSSHVEIDVYGGYRTKIADTIGLDVGLYTYYYPGDYPSPGYTLPYTTEAYVALSYGIVSLKYSHAFTNLFGFTDTKHSGYLDLSANWEFVPTWVLNGHIGHQDVKHFGAASYTDYKLGVTKNFDGGWSLAVAWYDTDADESVYTFPEGTFQGRSTGVLTLTKTF
ncbi:MAG: TorF family putative porin [Rudaea sp.]